MFCAFVALYRHYLARLSNLIDSVVEAEETLKNKEEEINQLDKI
jgi:hypothetical protein